MKMNIKLLLTIFALLSFFWLQAPMVAKAGNFIDIAKYMAWEDGRWILYQEYDCLDLECNPFLAPEELRGIKVSKENKYWWHSYYSDDGQPGSWIHGDEMKYQRTRKHVKMVGIKSNGEMWKFNPTIKIPRKLKLGKPFTYKGVARNGTKKMYFTLSFTIAKAGIQVSTAAGDFDDCIQVKTIPPSGPESGNIEIDIMARGVGVVKRWRTSIWKEFEGYADDAFEADTEYHEAIDYGSSDPPFPE